MYLAIPFFGAGASAGGWSSFDRNPRRLGDVNGDLLNDIIGFGENGVYVALGNSAAPGGYNPVFLATSEFGAVSGGWASFEAVPRQVGDVNGDGRSDIVGFGVNGTYVALANASGGFGPATLVTPEFGSGPGAGNWSSFDRYPRWLGDVNGDRQSDIVAFGENGTYVALGNASGGFGPTTLATAQFGAGASAGGWSSYDRYPRRLADLNGDGRDELVGFGENGVYVVFNNGSGGFGSIALADAEFGAGPGAGNWTTFDRFPRRLGDVNGDGRADIVAFGQNGTFVALGEFDAPGQFQATRLASTQFGTSTGWTSYEGYPRELSEVTADVNGDRREDLIAFGQAGTFVALATSAGDFV
jgi:FG-GAP-like repeat